MAFVDSDGRNISFECSALIDELKQDIAIMGEDRVVAVWCKPYGNVTLYTNYDFIDDENPITEQELKDGEHIVNMTIGALLPLLEKQNAIL